MSRKRQRNRKILKVRDKVLTKMTKDGLTNKNVTTGNNQRISKREADFHLRMEVAADEILEMNFDKSNSTEKRKRYSQVGTRNVDKDTDLAKIKSGKYKVMRSRKAIQKGQGQILSQNKDIPDVPTPIALHEFTAETVIKPKLPYDMPTSSKVVENNNIVDKDGISTAEITKKKDFIDERNSFTDDNTFLTDKPIEKGITPKTHVRNKYSSKRQQSKTLKSRRITNIRHLPEPYHPINPQKESRNCKRQKSFEPAVSIAPETSSALQSVIRETPTSDSSFSTISKEDITLGEVMKDTAAVQIEEAIMNKREIPISPEERPPPKSITPRIQQTEEKFKKENDSSSKPLPFQSPQTKQTGQSQTLEQTKESKPSSSPEQEEKFELHDLPVQEEQSQQVDLPQHNSKISKLEHKVEKTSKNLDKAKETLPTKRKLRIERAFDEQQDTGKTRLKFEKQVKSQGEHIKGTLPFRPVKFGANAAIANVHRKMYQVEHENVGTKAAHRTELVTEGVARSALYHRKTAPYKKVAKLERKLNNQSAKLAYQRTLQENPKLQKNLVSRIWQKRKIKKQYAKAAREAKKATAKSKKTATITGRITDSLFNLIRKNPKILILIVIAFLAVNVFSSLIGMLAGMGSGVTGTILASSYLSSEQDIEAVSLAYSEWEMDLLMKIVSAEQNHIGYDEYRFSTGDIAHNPFELMAYLTATRYVFVYDEMVSELRALFDEQYQLTFTSSVETKYHEQKTVNSDGEIEVELISYDWHVLTVTLTARNFTDVIYSRMDAEQRQHYSLLIETRGQRQIVGNPFDFGWLSFVTSEYGYRIHPISGERDLHRGIDIGVPLGTEIMAGFDGTVTFAGNSGGYGNVVILQGENGVEARYAHLDSINVRNGQSVAINDSIGTVGNTGTSTGVHLHLEVLRNGQYLNPLFFVNIGDFDFNNPSNPSFVPPNNTLRPPMSDNTWNAMIEEAERHLGKPYIFGASGPNAFDCSSYVSFVLRESGVKDVGRQTAQGLFNLSSPVSGSPQPGDLIFFHSYGQQGIMLTMLKISSNYGIHNALTVHNL